MAIQKLDLSYFIASMFTTGCVRTRQPCLTVCDSLLASGLNMVKRVCLSRNITLHWILLYWDFSKTALGRTRNEQQNIYSNTPANPLITYSRRQLLGMKVKSCIPNDLFSVLKNCGILKTRRSRSGKYKNRQNKNIPLLVGS